MFNLLPCTLVFAKKKTKTKTKKKPWKNWEYCLKGLE